MKSYQTIDYWLAKKRKESGEDCYFLLNERGEELICSSFCIEKRGSFYIKTNYDSYDRDYSKSILDSDGERLFMIISKDGDYSNSHFALSSENERIVVVKEMM